MDITAWFVKWPIGVFFFGARSCRPLETLLVVPDRLGYYPCMTEEKNPAAVELGRRGGLKGGKARAAKMTKEERSESARKAAKARWAKKRQQEESS
jgi:hypothetical protein